MSSEPQHFRTQPRPLTVAALQMSCGWDAQANLTRAEQLVREAAARGAVVLGVCGGYQLLGRSYQLGAGDTLEGVAPQYLWRFRPAGQFQRKNA